MTATQKLPLVRCGCRAKITLEGRRKGLITCFRCLDSAPVQPKREPKPTREDRLPGERKSRVKEAMREAHINAADLARLCGMEVRPVQNILYTNYGIRPGDYDRLMAGCVEAGKTVHLRERVDGRPLGKMRRAAGVSLERLGEELGINHATVFGWETGKQRPTREGYDRTVGICREELERRIREFEEAVG